MEPTQIRADRAVAVSRARPPSCPSLRPNPPAKRRILVPAHRDIAMTVLRSECTQRRKLRFPPGVERLPLELERLQPPDAIFAQGVAPFLLPLFTDPCGQDLVLRPELWHITMAEPVSVRPQPA